MRLALVLILLAQEKASIGFKPAQGEKLATTDSLALKVRGKIIVNGNEDELAIEIVRTRRASTEFAEVAEGTLRRKVLKVDEDIEKFRGDEKDTWDTSEQPLHGKTITLRLKDGTTAVEGIEKPNPETQRLLKLSEAEADLWPAGEVAVGASWESTRGAFVSRLLDLEETATKLTLTLQSVKEIGGRRCAIVALKGDIAGKAPNGTTYTLSLAGELTAVLDRGLVLTMKLEGKVKLAREHDTIKADGEGTIVIERKGEIK
jgi:hypothetical protein